MLHESFINFKGYDFNDVVRITSDVDFERTKILAKERVSKTVPVSEAKRLLEVSDIECLDIFGDLSLHKDLLIEIVARQSRLKYLAIHPALVNLLNSFSISKELETLFVIGGEGNAYVPEQFIHENIARVISVDSVLFFTKKSLPNIKYFHVKFDRRGGIRKLLDSYTGLVSATLLPTKSKEDFKSLPASLCYLRLINGQLSGLSNISVLENLTDLHMQNLPKLQDIEGLVSCNNLRDISIGYCNAIKNLERIAELHSLEKFDIYASKLSNKEEIEEKFALLKLKENSLSKME